MLDLLNLCVCVCVCVCVQCLVILHSAMYARVFIFKNFYYIKNVEVVLVGEYHGNHLLQPWI